jgi:hypothetical protein
MRVISTLGGLLIALLLAGCAGGQLPLNETPAVAPPPAPKFAMAGRWMLAAPGAPSCGMNFSGGPGARDGSIEPEGGCPGDFFTSRHWRMTGTTLTVNDHEHKPLGTLTLAGGYFAGKSTAGTPITLTRSGM